MAHANVNCIYVEGEGCKGIITFLKLDVSQLGKRYSSLFLRGASSRERRRYASQWHDCLFSECVSQERFMTAGAKV